MDKNDFIKTFKNKKEITRKEIISSGYTDSNIQRLIKDGLMSRSSRGVYKLEKNKEAQDFLNISINLFSNNNYKYSEKYLKKAMLLEPNNVYIHYRMLYFLIYSSKYDEALEHVKIIINVVDDNYWIQSCYLLLLLLSRLTNVEQELIDKCKVDVFCEKDIYEDSYLYEMLISCYRNIEEDNIVLANNKIKIVSKNGVYNRYFIKLLKLLIYRNYRLVVKNSNTYTTEGIVKFRDYKYELLTTFYKLLNDDYYNEALEIMNRIISIQKQINPYDRVLDNYIKYRILLTEIVDLQTYGISSDRDYYLNEYELNGNCIFNRYLEEHDFKNALVASMFTYRYADCINDYNKLLKTIESLRNRLKHERILKEEN